LAKSPTRRRSGVQNLDGHEMAELGYVNIFAQDVVKLAGFYADVFGFEEIVASRSPIFRGLKTKRANIGFNAYDAYELLNLPKSVDGIGIKVFTTFDVDSTAEVDRLTPIAVARGATLRKAPFTTYYGWYQSVLLDPEGNAFRINFVSA
jgi:predicted enzyme related to lactoylglutathione lyase